MYIGFLPVVLVVVSLASILVGIRGLMEGRRIGQMEGRNALMHYPVPLPWLKKRVTAARWVVWIGHLYLSTGLVGLLGAWLIGMTPAQYSHTHICNQLADRLVALYAEELRVEVWKQKARLMAVRPHCMTTKRCDGLPSNPSVRFNTQEAPLMKKNKYLSVLHTG